MDTYIDLPVDIVIDSSKNAYVINVFEATSSPEGVEMLYNINKACGLSSGEETKELPVRKSVRLLEALKSHSFRYVVAYGLSPKQVGLQLDAQLYNWIEFGDLNWCFAERLDTINADMARKKTLWACLKRIKDER